MAEPSNKSPEVAEIMDNFSLNLFGRKRTEAIQKDICVDCGGEAKKFKNQVSLREYLISGLCQKCQDRIWRGL